MRHWWRLGGAAGIVFVVLFAVGLVAFQFDVPLYDDPIEDIRAYWVDDGQQYLVGNYLIAVGFAFFFLPFIASLRAVLGRAEGGAQVFSRVTFAAGFLFLIWGAMSSFFWGTLAFGNFAAETNEETIRTLMHLDLYAFSGIGLAVAILALASSLVIAQRRWLAIPGVITGVLGTLSPLRTLSAESDSFFAILWLAMFPAILLYILLVSIAMLMSKEEPTETSAARPM